MIAIRSKERFVVCAIVSLVGLITLAIFAAAITDSPFFILITTLLGLVLSLPLWRTPLNGVFVLEEYVGLELAFLQRLRIVIYGTGGAGKTTLLARTFANRGGITRQTKGIVTRAYVLPYGERQAWVSVTDYEGQREYLVRERLTRLFDKNVDVRVLIIMLAAFEVSADTNQVDIPNDTEARSAIISRHLERQLARLPDTVLLELVRHCKGLHTVYVLLNHANLIMEHQEEIDLVKEMIKPMLRTLRSTAEDYRHAGETRQVQICFEMIDARNGNTLRLDQKHRYVMGNLHLLEETLRREEEMHDNIPV